MCQCGFNCELAMSAARGRPRTCSATNNKNTPFGLQCKFIQRHFGRLNRYVKRARIVGNRHSAQTQQKDADQGRSSNPAVCLKNYDNT